MTIIDRMRRLNWRLIAAAFLAIGILHICATLAAPNLMRTSAYERLAPLLPANRMHLLAPSAPNKQPLPFMGPDMRYAMCRFDASNGPVILSASLPDRGWSLTLYAPEGDAIYAATGHAGRPSEITLHLVSTDERFTGLTPEARGQPQTTAPALILTAREGVAVVRAPDRGSAYSAQIEHDIGRARCSAVAP